MSQDHDQETIRSEKACEIGHGASAFPRVQMLPHGTDDHAVERPAARERALEVRQRIAEPDYSR
jgi:hypothetical protein